MEFGSVWVGEWLEDLGALREGAAMLDEAGFDFAGHGGHVLTAREGRYERPRGTYAVPFRDPFVLYSHLATLTKRLKFRPAIFILPMFPTVLVAKQSADLSLISGGRFELGVGISWQDVEYRAMGEDVTMRGRRLEEQLVVLKQLWSEPYVTFSGRFHEIDDLGIVQLPETQIPIWVGSGDGDQSLLRIARLADGWMPSLPPSPERVERLQQFAAEAGRTGQVGVTGRLTANATDPEAARADYAALVSMGVTAVSINPPPGSTLLDGTRAVIATRDDLAAQTG